MIRNVLIVINMNICQIIVEKENLKIMKLAAFVKRRNTRKRTVTFERKRMTKGRFNS